MVEVSSEINSGADFFSVKNQKVDSFSIEGVFKT